MAFFKRVEVWVLLILSIAAVVAVLRMEQADKGVRASGASVSGGGDQGKVEAGRSSGPDGARSNAGGDVSSLRIRSLRLERDADHAVVEIVLDQPVAAADSASVSRLLRADGSEVEPFFVPFAVAEDGAYLVDGKHALLFWADRSTVAGALFLERDGQRVQVKAADGFSLDSIRDGDSVELSGLPNVRRDGVELLVDRRSAP